MPDQLQLRGGTTTEHNSFTGITREVTVDTTKKTLVVHDGSTQGGVPLMRESGSNAASAVGIGTGGNNVINIDSNGRVTIGTSTTNSSDKFTIVDPGNAFMSIRSDAAADNTIQSLDFAFGTANRSSNNLTGVIAANIHSQSGGTLKSNLEFYTNSGNSISQKMIIKDTGNVGIGTTSPEQILHLNKSSGDTYLRIQGGTNQGTLINKTDGTLVGGFVSGGAVGGGVNDIAMRVESGNNMLFAHGTSERMRIDSSGRVSIGSTSGVAPLNVKAETDGNLHVRPIGSIASAPAGSGVGLDVLNDAANAVKDLALRGSTVIFRNASAESMRIDSSGRLLLGTVSTTGISSSADDIIIGSTGDSTDRGITLATSGVGSIRWADAGDNAMGRISYSNSNDIMNFHTANATRLTIDANGKCGIGTTSPDQTLHVRKGDAGGVDSTASSVITLENNDNATLQFLCPNNKSAQLRFGDVQDNGVGYIDYDHNQNRLSFATNGPEKMRIDSSGNLLVGTTNNDSGGSAIGNDFGFVYLPSGHAIVRSGSTSVSGASGIAYTAKFVDTGGSKAFRVMLAQTEMGSITVGSGGTAFNTSSDYRRKENVVELTGAITRLKTLLPKRFNFKDEPSVTRDGFLAHEVTAVPEAVYGTKDAVEPEDNENSGAKKGDPIYQQLDQSKLVPLLTAALQEAITKIETLETKVAALEAA